jgi:hypothetical protein
MPFTRVVIILVAISIVGAIAIPFGDPQFLGRAIALELSFITLAVLTYKGFRKALYACIPLAIIVMVGNSLASPHVEIMTTFSKPFNAIMLIIGGYVLQGALFGTTIFHLESRRQDIIQKQKKN